MSTATKNVYRERIDFAKIKTSIPIPNLIEIQKNSYERFLQMRVLPQDREDAGLQSVFKSIFPITDLRENCSLEFVDYSIGNWECKCGRLVGLDKLGKPCSFCAATIITDPRGDREVHCPKCGHFNENRPVTCETCDEPVGLKLKYDVDECQERGMTFAVPLKVTIRLVVWDKDPETGAKTIRDIKEQEVYYGDIPLMTENGTFIINGTERVIVSQLHRSPGVFFSQPEKGLFAAQIIPYRGSWVEFEFDAKNLLHVRIDRKRKFLASVFLRALGMRSDAEILKRFYRADRILAREGRLFWKTSPNLVGLKLSKAVFGPRDASGKRDEIVHAGKKVTAAHLAEIQRLDVQEIEITEADLEGAYSVADIVDPRTGEVVLEGNEPLSPRVVSVVLAEGSQIDSFEVFFPERDEIGPMLSMTVKKDTIKSPEEALIEIYRRMRPGDPPTLESSRNLFEGMFLNSQKYDFSRVGRLKLNTKLGLVDPPHREDHPPRGHRGGDRLPAEAAPQPAGRGRHRPPRQPPGAQRRRAAREPVPHRPRPDGARDQGEDERLPGDGHGHAPRPHQRQAGHGLDPRVLRVEPAQPVHGPDEPALGDHPQAAPLRPRPGRPQPRAGRASRCATCTPPTTAASARSRPRKARTSASSRASAASPASTSSGSSRAPTAR